MFLLDTNILSELYKKQPNPGVMAWFARERADEARLYVSVMTLGEIQHGAEKIKHRDPLQAISLEFKLDKLKEEFEGYILPVDDAIALDWGRILKKDGSNRIDALFVATARVHQLTLVTRNVKHVRDFDVAFLNPFS